MNDTIDNIRRKYAEKRLKGEMTHAEMDEIINRMSEEEKTSLEKEILGRMKVVSAFGKANKDLLKSKLEKRGLSWEHVDDEAYLKAARAAVGDIKEESRNMFFAYPGPHSSWPRKNKIDRTSR